MKQYTHSTVWEILGGCRCYFQETSPGAQQGLSNEDLPGPWVHWSGDVNLIMKTSLPPDTEYTDTINAHLNNIN